MLLQFAQPSAAELMRQTEALVAETDLDFLWECAPEEEFGFAELAAEYYGAEAGPVQQAALAMALHGSPVYFRRKGRGRYLRAPEDQLKAALAALERKRQQALVQAEYEAQLKARQLPEAFRGKVMGLLFKPDKNSLEYKAMDAACTALGMTPMRLMLECGGVESACAARGQVPGGMLPKGHRLSRRRRVEPPADLPVADVQAFSIDDVTTTEIDDALSVVTLPDGKLRVGIHIAAPGLGIRRGDALDAIARQRLSTVYFPGDKITMLPDAVVERYTLQEGRQCPALSLYVTVDPSLPMILGSETRAELVPIAANLRHNLLEDVVTEQALAEGSGDYPFRDELAKLWQFAGYLYDERQKARLASGLRPEVHNRADYELLYRPARRWRRTRAHRAAPARSPLDKIVAELMILASSTWAAAGRPRRAGHLPHAEGLGHASHPHADLSGAARGPGCGPVRLEHLAAAPLCRPGQPVADHRGGTARRCRQAGGAVQAKDADLLAAVADFEGPTPPTPTTSRPWSATGACAGWSKRSASA